MRTKSSKNYYFKKNFILINSWRLKLSPTGQIIAFVRALCNTLTVSDFRLPNLFIHKNSMNNGSSHKFGSNMAVTLWNKCAEEWTNISGKTSVSQDTLFFKIHIHESMNFLARTTLFFSAFSTAQWDQAWREANNWAYLK